MPIESPFREFSLVNFLARISTFINSLSGRADVACSLNFPRSNRITIKSIMQCGKSQS